MTKTGSTKILTVCCFYWRDPQKRHGDVCGQYTPEHVKALRAMVAKHLETPHEFVCITDENLSDVRTVQIDRSLFKPGKRLPKLQLFRRDAAEWLGSRIFYLDLDCVIVGSLETIVHRAEPLVLWRNPHYGEKPQWAPFNSSMILLDAGSRPDIHETFDPDVGVPQWDHDDQDWISAHVELENPHWDHTHGVWNQSQIPGTRLPAGARIVHFPGRRDPAMIEVQRRHPWIREHRAC
jgi:hypothetical protein